MDQLWMDQADHNVRTWLYATELTAQEVEELKVRASARDFRTTVPSMSAKEATARDNPLSYPLPKPKGRMLDDQLTLLDAPSVVTN